MTDLLAAAAVESSFWSYSRLSSPSQQKTHLQTILKPAHVYTDGRVELEFRE